MARTITLPEDDGTSGSGAGSVTMAHPDTLEVIRRDDVPRVPFGSSAPLTAAAPLLRTAPSTPAQSAEPLDPPRLSAPEELQALLRQFREERRQRHSIWAARALTAVVAVGLLGVWLLRPPLSGGDENRAQTSFPALSTGGLVTGKDYRQTDAALRDRLALRKYVVKAVGQTAHDRDTSLNPEVVIGPSGVPFLSQDFTFPCQYDFDPVAVDAGLRDLRAIGASTGKTITVAIAPDKSSILTSQLGSRAGALMACSDKVRQETESTWADSPSSPVLYAWKQLAAEQAAHPGKVFQRGDSHWTSQGALVWAHALIGRLVEQGEAPASLRHAPNAVLVGNEAADNDLYRLMGITRTESVPLWQVHRRGVRLRDKSLKSPSGRGIAIFHASATGSADSADSALITGRTLIINDSFISRAEGELAPYFSDLEVMHWADFVTAVQSGKAPHFDRIIIETVQRGWPQRGTWLQSGQPIHDAIAKELAEPRTDQ